MLKIPSEVGERGTKGERLAHYLLPDEFVSLNFKEPHLLFPLQGESLSTLC